MGELPYSISEHFNSIGGFTNSIRELFYSINELFFIQLESFPNTYGLLCTELSNSIK